MIFILVKEKNYVKISARVRILCVLLLSRFCFSFLLLI